MGYWAEAVTAAVYIKNRILISAVFRSIFFERWTGYKSRILYLSFWEFCLCFYFKRKEEKDAVKCY